MVLTAPYPTPRATPLSQDTKRKSASWSSILRSKFRGTSHEGPPPIFAIESTRRRRILRRPFSRRFRKIIWISLILTVGLIWLTQRGKQPSVLDTSRHDTRQTNLTSMQFIDAHYPNIRCIGRWWSSTDGAHKYASFAGSYFEFSATFNGSVVLSLLNSNNPKYSLKQRAYSLLSLLPSDKLKLSTSGLISFLAQVDGLGYKIFPEAFGLIPIYEDASNLRSTHRFRFIAPMVGDSSTTFQVKGIWIDEKAALIPYHGINTSNERGHRLPSGQRKFLEIVTDLSSSPTRERRHADMTIRELSDAMGWEFPLGEMLGCDHVTVGARDMCLTANCIERPGRPTSLPNVFFRSGTPESELFDQFWNWQYTPDIILLNIGNSDWESFQMHGQQYTMNSRELSAIFEDTYYMFINAIRQIAYPKLLTTTLDSSHFEPNLGKDIPIFVMRPLRGQLAQATNSVVGRLRRDGDKAVFWLDTSGWLNTEVAFDQPWDQQDFFLDDGPAKLWRLTERGNQRVVDLLYLHLCPYLAHNTANCTFLPPGFIESY